MYTIFMRLKIRNITNRDFGTYRCVARNSLGESDGAIKLYGKKIILFTLKVLCVSLIIEIPTSFEKIIFEEML